MAIGSPQRRRAPLRVWLMLASLIIAAIAGAAIGLIWDSADWLSEDSEEEVVTAEQPAG